VSNRQRIAIGKELGDRAEEGAAYGHLENACDSLGDYDKAIEHHRSPPAAARGARRVRRPPDKQSATKYQVPHQYLAIAKELGDWVGD
jgi:hypothetical protein